MKINPLFSILIIATNLLFASTSFAERISDYNYDSCWLRLIQIDGFTNVNRFSFTYQTTDRAIATSLQKNGPVNRAFGFQIPVRDFKGSNPAMKKDFLQLMQANQYPQVSVSFLNKDFDNISVKTSQSDLNLNLTLAGVKKVIKAKCSTTVIDDDKILLHGKTEVKLTDFSLTPPEKAFGLIRVKDLVVINFDLVIKTSNKQVASREIQY